MNLYVFYSYNLIGKLTVSLQLQELSLCNQTVDCSTSVGPRSPPTSNLRLGTFSSRLQLAWGKFKNVFFFTLDEPPICSGMWGHHLLRPHTLTPSPIPIHTIRLDHSSPTTSSHTVTVCACATRIRNTPIHAHVDLTTGLTESILDFLPLNSTLTELNLEGLSMTVVARQLLVSNIHIHARTHTHTCTTSCRHKFSKTKNIVRFTVFVYLGSDFWDFPSADGLGIYRGQTGARSGSRTRVSSLTAVLAVVGWCQPCYGPVEWQEGQDCATCWVKGREMVCQGDRDGRGQCDCRQPLVRMCVYLNTCSMNYHRIYFGTHLLRKLKMGGQVRGSLWAILLEQTARSDGIAYFLHEARLTLWCEMSRLAAAPLDRQRCACEMNVSHKSMIVRALYWCREGSNYGQLLTNPF